MAKRAILPIAEDLRGHTGDSIEFYEMIFFLTA
jgi:hypothetical protein